MYITLSFRKYAQVIREAEGLDPSTTDSEIAVRLDHYSSRIWQLMNEFGIRMVGLAEKTPDVAAFQVSIAGVGRNYQTQDFDWQKLREGLDWLRPVAVTLTQDDIEQICTGPVCTAMVDRFEEYAHTLQRILPSQIQSAVEAACLKYAWGNRSEFDTSTGNAALDYDLDTAQLERAGLKDPLEKYRKQQAFNEAEIEAEKARQRAAYAYQWGEEAAEAVYGR